jgi:hypothetical protein
MQFVGRDLWTMIAFMKINSDAEKNTKFATHGQNLHTIVLGFGHSCRKFGAGYRRNSSKELSFSLSLLGFSASLRSSSSSMVFFFFSARI